MLLLVAPVPARLPAGERLVVQLDGEVGTAKAKAGDRFTARVVAPAGLLPAEARLDGEVALATRGSKDVSPELRLRVRSLRWRGCRAKLRARVTSQESDPVSRPPSKVGQGAATAGALVGGLLLGVRGAAGGFGAGFVVGTVDDAAHAERVDALLRDGALLTVQLDAPLDLRACASQPPRWTRSTDSPRPM
jgi:hypothetical protein